MCGGQDSLLGHLHALSRDEREKGGGGEGREEEGGGEIFLTQSAWG